MDLRKREAHHGKTARIVVLARWSEAQSGAPPARQDLSWLALGSIPASNLRKFVISPQGFLTLSALPPRPR